MSVEVASKLKENGQESAFILGQNVITDEIENICEPHVSVTVMP